MCLLLCFGLFMKNQVFFVIASPMAIYFYSLFSGLGKNRKINRLLFFFCYNGMIFFSFWIIYQVNEKLRYLIPLGLIVSFGIICLQVYVEKLDRSLIAQHEISAIGILLSFLFTIVLFDVIPTPILIIVLFFLIIGNLRSIYIYFNDGKRNTIHSTEYLISSVILYIILIFFPTILSIQVISIIFLSFTFTILFMIVIFQQFIDFKDKPPLSS